MSGGKYSVVTKLPSIRNYFPTTAVKRSDNISLHNELSVSSLADSPEACEGCEDPEGLVSLPGAETDFQIKDIPIVTAEGVTGPDMVYMKTIAPSVNPSYLASTCSSPDTSTSPDTAGPPTTTDFDHMYASLSKANTNVLMAENVHLREMLVSQLDLIQQQSETILSKDKQLKQLREENGLLVQRLSRMERRCRGEAGSSSGGGAAAQRKPPGVSQSGVQKRTRDHDPVTLSTPDTGLKKKKVEASPRWSEKVVPVNNEVVDAFGSSDYELMDEFMSDAEILSVSRPDTPASVASVDTVQSDTTIKSNKKSKKLSLEGKRKSANFKASTDVVAEKEPKIKKLKTQTSGTEELQLQFK